MYISDTAPPLITFKDPDGGLGLRARSAEEARRRIDVLFGACAVDVSLEAPQLSVYDPCARALYEALDERREPGTLTDIVRAYRHEPSAVAAAAWAAFGPPGQSGSAHVVDSKLATDARDLVIQSWSWDLDPTRFDEAFAFLCRHQRLMRDDYATAVWVGATWQFRLRSTAGTVAQDRFPPSRIAAHLAGKHASAFFGLIFPYTSAEPAFVADYEAACAALGIALPRARFRLCQKGRYKKVAGF